jgi:hypothetical protein
MEAVDLLAVLGAIALFVGVAMLTWMTSRMLAAASRLEQVTAEFTAAAGPLLAELANSTNRAAHEVERVENLIDVSSEIADRVDRTTGATYRAITKPAIKGVAFAEGTRRAARRLGGRKSPTAG